MPTLTSVATALQTGRGVRKLNINTGSETDVSLVTFPSGQIVAVKSQRRDGSRLRGLQYEANMYRITNRLVSKGICPFFLRGASGPELPRSLVTESFPKMGTLHDFLKRRLTQKQALYLLVQLLYTLCVMQRVGLRHNDLHSDNVFVVRCGGGRAPAPALLYVSPQGREHTLYMPGCDFQILVFDMDRVTKAARPMLQNELLKVSVPGGAVTSLWSWYNPHIDSGHYNTFKVVSGLMKKAKKYRTADHLARLLDLVCATGICPPPFSSPLYAGYNKSYLNKYALLLKLPQMKETNVPSFLRGADDFMQALIVQNPVLKETPEGRGKVVGNMRLLKRKAQK